MITAPTQANGHPRPLPDLGERRPVEQDNPTEPPTPAVDPISEAEAAAIRARTYAETEAIRIEAEGKADAARTLAATEAERQRLANERTAMRVEKERAAHEAHLAEINRKREESDRLARQARKAEEAEQQKAEKADEEVAKADAKWRTYAIRFAIVCGIVALPVQIAAFWNPEAWWLVAAPVMLEGGSWVVQRGAAAAVANRRPLWHYRTIAWLLAFIAAGINLWHGWHAFDPATAIATAFASVAGPGVWDLHEHGRIRKRDGALTRRERNAAKEVAKKQAEEEAAAEKVEAERQAHLENAARASAAALDANREENFPKVWKHALKLAAALGETTVTESVWRRAHNDIEGTEPGSSVDIIRGRNSAARRVEAARSEAPGNKPTKVTSPQRASQMPPTSKTRRYNPPARSGRRRPGDTPKYVPAAKKQASITARTAATEEQK
ncbi:hypothetical protein GCM10011583_18200 [Streptomyces camponoticapitis]|uniref:DUF2637 domain-containing protein n=1 Tax=Streptomyces camponoticapitis TaxID=1616125 RepID=A0ABQ2E2V6_9ACTN|nr:hypothetical protein [Streptomyces camponoticapitis]GGJ86946.1 hypothetical protein GCM10011583_18200 [Streptomyces camponoticapitis]